jgi:hypothetical protein
VPKFHISSEEYPTFVILRTWFASYLCGRGKLRYPNAILTSHAPLAEQGHCEYVAVSIENISYVRLVKNSLWLDVKFFQYSVTVFFKDLITI